jgi:hypothetical protein
MPPRRFSCTTEAHLASAVSCRLRKPDWHPCAQPGWSGGRAARANQGLGRVRLKMMIASTRQAAATVTCQWAGAPSARPSGPRHLFDHRVAGTSTRTFCLARTLAELRDRASARLRPANHAPVRQIQHRLGPARHRRADRCIPTWGHRCRPRCSIPDPSHNRRRVTPAAK